MSKIKVKHGRFTKKSWVVNEKGKRISDKFHLYEEYKLGDFIRLKTSEGFYLYHKKTGQVILSKENYPIQIFNITPNLVGVKCCTAFEKHAMIYNLAGQQPSTTFDDFGVMQNGLIPVCIGGRWGFVNENLKIVISLLWQKVSNFNENGYAVVYFKDLKRLAVINKKGEYICSPCEGSYAEFITDDLLMLHTSKYKYGVITKEGKVIVKTVYDNINVRGDYIIVRNGKHYGLFDIEGNEIFECIYPEIIETDKKFIFHDFTTKEILKVKEQEK